MPWFVSYDDATGALNRCGDEPQPAEKGFTCEEVLPTPVIIDPVSGEKLMGWDRALRTFVPFKAPAPKDEPWDLIKDRRRLDRRKFAGAVK